MGTLWVAPCGATKLAQPAPAAQLYTSSHFSLVLRAAQAAAATWGGSVTILSALHGLVGLDDVLAPYDVTMRDAGSVPAWQLGLQLAALVDDQGVTSVTTLLPRAYRDRLQLAATAADVLLVDLYANAPGIGYQRGVAARLLAAAGAAMVPA